MENKSIKEEIFEVIDRYYKERKLPPMLISDKEWDSFFEVVYSHFKRNRLSDNDYRCAMNILVRKAMYLAEIYNEGSFNAYHLRASLADLTAYNMNAYQIHSIRTDLDGKIMSYKK